MPLDKDQKTSLLLGALVAIWVAWLVVYAAACSFGA